mmetsp:Transcript_45698/g.51539  ORF Transcript_45698/g.51539 Transcript_45698/m.51539 type:complete len:98 (+) Transcript_45698:96-389(+)
MIYSAIMLTFMFTTSCIFFIVLSFIVFYPIKSYKFSVGCCLCHVLSFFELEKNRLPSRYNKSSPHPDRSSCPIKVHSNRSNVYLLSTKYIYIHAFPS